MIDRLCYVIALQEVDKLDGYKQTKVDPQKVVDLYKSRFLVVTHM